MNKKLISRTAVLCLIVLAAAGLALVDASTSAETIAGNYVWITRAANDPGHAVCQAQNAGSECVELCMQATSGIISMNKFCCIDPSLIGGWDNPEECESWLH